MTHHSEREARIAELTHACMTDRGGQPVHCGQCVLCRAADALAAPHVCEHCDKCWFCGDELLAVVGDHDTLACPTCYSKLAAPQPDYMARAIGLAQTAMQQVRDGYAMNTEALKVLWFEGELAAPQPDALAPDGYEASVVLTDLRELHERLIADGDDGQGVVGHVLNYLEERQANELHYCVICGTPNLPKKDIPFWRQYRALSEGMKQELREYAKFKGIIP